MNLTEIASRAKAVASDQQGGIDRLPYEIVIVGVYE